MRKKIIEPLTGLKAEIRGTKGSEGMREAKQSAD